MNAQPEYRVRTIYRGADAFFVVDKWISYPLANGILSGRWISCQSRKTGRAAVFSQESSARRFIANSTRA